MTLLNRPSLNIAFSTEALKANLSRLEDEWETYQTTRDRDGIYGYLAAVFELVMWWKHEHKALSTLAGLCGYEIIAPWSKSPNHSQP